MTPAISGLTAALLYLIGTVVQWRRPAGASFIPRTFWALALPAIVLHGLTVYNVIATPQGLNLGIFHVGCLITLVMVVVFVLMLTRIRAEGLLLFVFPLCALTLIAPIALSSSFQPLTQLSNQLTIHIIISIIAYGILLMVAAVALMVGLQERYLKSRQTNALHKLPPLETMEQLLFSTLWTGFVCLTLAIASGFIFLDDMFGQNVSHHTILSCLSWLTYVVLLTGRYVFGWRGTTAVRWVLLGFFLLLLSYFGSKFVVEILLDR